MPSAEVLISLSSSSRISAEKAPFSGARDDDSPVNGPTADTLARTESRQISIKIWPKTHLGPAKVGFSTMVSPDLKILDS